MLDSLSNFVKNAPGKYYLHCYLGKDRVNTAKRIILKVLGDEELLVSEIEDSERVLSDTLVFERGKITMLGDSIYYTPYPTDEEFMGYIIAPGINTVVSLLNPKDPNDRKLIEEEKKILATYFVDFVNIPLDANSSKAEIKAAWEIIKQKKKPIVVHHFLSDKPSSVHFINNIPKENK